MHEQLVEVLVTSKNEAADDLLVEGLRLGAEPEQSVILNAIFQRNSVLSLSVVVDRYESLTSRLLNRLLGNIKTMHHALRDCGRSDRPELRQAAMRLIALS